MMLSLEVRYEDEIIHIRAEDSIGILKRAISIDFLTQRTRPEEWTLLYDSKLFRQLDVYDKPEEANDNSTTE